MPQVVPDGWTQTESSLTRTLQCAGFIEALATVVEIGRLAERADHHPDIDIRYRTLHLSLSTHASGNTLTTKDYELAQKINDLKEDAVRLSSDELRRRFQA